MKIFLFERCGNFKVYVELIKVVIESDDGKVLFIFKWEESISVGNIFKFDVFWDDEFVLEWFRLFLFLGS